MITRRIPPRALLFAGVRTRHGELVQCPAYRQALTPKKEEIDLFETYLSSLAEKLKASPKVIREIVYGLLFHEIVTTTQKERGHLDNLFMLVIFGDLIGLPLLPPYYSLRLLPHIVPSLETWKRRILRERDLTDFVAHDLT